jgi:hypothetical protein
MWLPDLYRKAAFSQAPAEVRKLPAFYTCFEYPVTNEPQSKPQGILHKSTQRIGSNETEKFFALAFAGFFVGAVVFVY